jgi:hypothetical protein
MQLAELGGSTKTQGQDTRGARIQGAGVARFFGTQQPLGLLQGLVA